MLSVYGRSSAAEQAVLAVDEVPAIEVPRPLVSTANTGRRRRPGSLSAAVAQQLSLFFDS